MLLSLKIENYALIRSLMIEFKNGFSVLTGETGAGKSIILGALSLVLGNRADTQVLSDKDKKCIVEAVFETDDNLKEIFNDNDLDFQKQSIFRREITPTGKSRAFINDTPVGLQVMKDFANYLIDIHSQSSTINLRNHAYQLSVIDSLSENPEVLASYKDLYKKYKALNKSIADLQQRQAELLKEKSYNEFLYNELNDAALQENEQEEQERLSELISNSEKIKENITESLNILDNESDANILGLLNETSYRLGRIASHNKTLSELYKRLESANIELKDIYSELNSFNNETEFDAGKLQEITDRLNLIYALQRKHNVKTISELLTIKDDLQQKLLISDNIDSDIEEKISLKNEYIRQLDSLADEIHASRLQSAELLQSEILPLLASMAMNDAVLKAEITKEDDFTSDGKDKVRFLFNANKTKSNQMQELSHVISGGELSRLMLAIKAVTAKKYSVPTLIFDEIDTGISGDIASKTADIMLMIASSKQVIAITHLVQMAAKADNHYKVFKQTSDNQTESNITLLNREQRIDELAKMLSGDMVTKQAVANAKALLSKNK
ncbi:MAG: DNA repair protein RecN [Bacteroidales bacterium]|nr:DNA repair protein RecN [Bacteroidales bacterium]